MGELKLSEEFLAKYREKQPDWGYDGFGYVVYLRTYARRKEDGKLEEWWETVKRVTEGNFEIEENRLKELGKWNDEVRAKLQAEMERFYDLVFNLVISPPGRGLWMSGTDYEKRVGDALNNCLRGTERVFVKNMGLVPISELNGEYEVLSDGGVYRKAYFKSYGKQKLMKVTFSDGQVVYATPEHEWIVLSGNSGQRKKERVKTKDLQGHKIPIVRPRIPQTVDPEGVAHGYVYGDGTLTPSGYCRLHYFDNDPDLFNLIAKYGTVSQSKIPTITRLPYHWKKLPKIGEHSDEYLLGFLMGWIAADGNVKKGNVRLFCKDENVLEYARELAMYLGLKVGKVILQRKESPYDGTIKPLYYLTFSTETFPGHLLQIKKQREAWDKYVKSAKARRIPKVPYKEVVSVEMTDLEEEVYCCVEPETHSFVIDGHILTGNCWQVTMRPQEYIPGDGNPKVSFAPVFTFDQAMKGGGVGVNIQKKYVEQIPKVNNKLDLHFICSNEHKDFQKLEKLGVKPKYEWTNNDVEIFTVPDSRQGWCESLKKVIDYHYDGITELVLDLSEIRPEGSPIRGFGGVASGPGPLVEMLKRVNEILNRRVGDYVTPTEWGDIIQNIGVCVVAGNVRRTALILIGDKDDQEFIESKNYSLEKNRVASQWRWASNNSVDISPNENKETLKNLAKNIYYNGEPGYVNIELSKNYGRIADGYQEGIDAEVEGFNPCLTGDSLLLTDKGLRRIDSLVGESFMVWDGSAFVPSKAWMTGAKEAFLVRLSNGQSFKATADHKVMTADGSWVEVKDLLGKEIAPMAGADWEGAEYDTKLMEFLGYMQGDGSIDEVRCKVYVNIGKRDAELIDAFNLREFAKTHGNKPHAWYIPFDMWRNLNVIGVKSLPVQDRDLPDALFTASPKSVAAFLRGLFSANGSVIRTRVTLKAVNRRLVEQVQLLLLALGIRSYITTNKAHKVKFDNGTYTCRESYDLNITGDSLKVFAEKIGFLHSYKQEKLATAVARVGEHKRNPKVVSIESVGYVPVYDFTSPVKHYGWVQGLPIHNCGEITLPNASPCNLFEINLPRIHQWIQEGRADESLYDEAVRLGTRYAYRVTFRPYEWATTRDVVYRHRRLGIGITGFTDWVLLKFGEKAVLGFDKNGNPLYNNDVTAFLDKLYKKVREVNIEHAKELEANPSIKVTTVKPSGTISLLMGVSPGMHFHWAPYMIRRMRLSAKSPLVPVLLDCGYYMEPAIKGFDENGNYVYDYSTVVVEFPIKAPTAEHPKFQSAKDVSLREQAAIQALLAAYWSDNAVSATLTFKKGTNPIEDEIVINEITDVLNFLKDKVKSTSMLPYQADTYPQMPYEAITKEKYEEMISKLKAKPWEIIKDGILADIDETDDSLECQGGACPVK